MNEKMPFLDKEISNILKGIAAVYIMIGHSMQLPYWQLGFLAFGGGYLFVGLFFFYSGYGLKSAVKTNKDYLKGFLISKLMKIYVPFLIAESCYAILKASFCSDFSELLFECIGIKLSNTILWYVLEILVLYLLFYLFEKNKIPDVTYCFVWIAFALIAAYTDMGSWWYVSTPCFILGIFVADYKIEVRKVKRTRLLKIVLCFSFLMTDYLYHMVSEYKMGFWKISSTYIGVAMMIVSAILFVIALMLITERSIARFRILKYLGKLSYLIYLWHGFFIFLLSNYIKNEIMLAIAVTGGTVTFSAFYYVVRNKLMNLKKKRMG